MTDRLITELRLLRKVELAYGVHTGPIVRQLVEDETRPLPDVFPPAPQWTTFKWPRSGVVAYTREHYQVDWSVE